MDYGRVTISEKGFYRVSKKITLLIGIYFYITISTGMHLTYTIQEINILQESAIETTPTPTLLPWLSWKQICCFLDFEIKILEIE